MTKLDVAPRDFEAEPARSAFAARYRDGRPQVVWTRLVADLETPVSPAADASAAGFTSPHPFQHSQRKARLALPTCCSSTSL